jgi:uncharacterized protein (DUF433 family)
MTTPFLTLSTTEAAFLADLPQRKINQVVDDCILPPRLYTSSAKARRFVPMAAALVRFYFDAEKVVAASARKQILAELVKRVHKLPAEETARILMLTSKGRKATWHVQPQDFVDINLAGFVDATMVKLHLLQKANQAVEVNPAVMGGAPVFKGTRVPVRVVLESLRQGDDFHELKEDYPFLTEELVELAQVYDALHPQRGRPKSLREQFLDWRVERQTVHHPV